MASSDTDTVASTADFCRTSSAAASAELVTTLGPSSNAVSQPNQLPPDSNLVPPTNDYGPAPFDETSTGDCIIKASDGLKFKLHRVILQIASSVWKDMFDMPQPTGHNEAREVPIIELSEPSTTLLHLFRFLYPIGKDQIMAFDLALKLVEAYDKYGLDLSNLIPYFADLLTRSSLQTKPVEAYGLAWRIKKGEAVSMASRYLHQIALEKREIRDRLIRYSGDVDALLALYSLRHCRELALDNFIAALPISIYRCPQHKNISPVETRKLRISARKALGSAAPHCSDVVQFLGLREVFSDSATLPTTTTSSLFTFNPNLAPNAAPPPPSTQKVPSQTCVACESAFTSFKLSTVAGVVNLNIAIFPQAVKWPPTD